ncbi:MAG: tetratricopeptide repeat protein [Coriobacteriia bacterium]|jgi:predicted Zn-dependent protease|nr:tetratricopeptide repeat protein [Coriobacteriia bacterium]
MFATAALLGIAIVLTLSCLACTIRSVPEYEYAGAEQVDEYLAILRQEPDNIAANLGIAYEYQQIGRVDDALFHYNHVLDLVPDEPAALSNRGIILLQQGDTERGVSDLKAALAADPGHEHAAVALGAHYLKKRAPQDALDVLLPAIRERPRSAELHYLAGRAFEVLGEVPSAINQYRAALVQYADMAEARRALDRLGVAP